MSVAEDGNEQEQPGESQQRADRAARHRVPPTASASAKVPVLPAPFNPAKPTFPTGAAIPRQRRGGPTAIATASIPVIPVEDDKPDFDALFADALGDDPTAPDSTEPDPTEPDPTEPEDLSADPFSDEFSDPFSDDVGAATPDQSDAAASGEDEDEDPATVGTLAGEVRASAVPFLADPVTLGKPPAGSPALVDPAAFDASPVPDPPAALDASADASADASPAADEQATVVMASVGTAPVVVTPDDSPTVADYVPPAFAIVTDDPADAEDGPDYRGARRRSAAWRRYPVGAVAVAVLILLVTAAVVLQLVRSDGSGTPVAAESSPQRFPGVGGLPELTPNAASSPSPSPSATRSSASPSPSRSRSSAPAVAPPSASKSASSAAPPPPQVTSGQFVGAGSRMCLEYRAGDNNKAVIDNCERPGSGRSNQRWTIQSDGSVHADGGCLDVANAGTGNGNAVQLYECNGTVAQKWTYRGDGTLLNPHSGRCLDVANGGTGAGNPVIIWDCGGAANQKWTRQSY